MIRLTYVEYGQQLYCCWTAVAKKNYGKRLVIHELAETLRAGFRQTTTHRLYTPGNGKCSCKIAFFTMARHIE